MVNKSANDTDRSNAGGGTAGTASVELDGATDESPAPSPEEIMINDCPDPDNCTKPGATLDSGLRGTVAA
jgi:hypothetical protein